MTPGPWPVSFGLRTQDEYLPARQGLIVWATMQETLSVASQFNGCCFQSTSDDKLSSLVRSIAVVQTAAVNLRCAAPELQRQCH